MIKVEASHPAVTVSSPPPSLSILCMPLVDPIFRPGPSRPSIDVFSPQCNISLALDSIITSIPILNLSGPSSVGSGLPIPSVIYLDKPHYNLLPQEKRDHPNDPVGGLNLLYDTVGPPKTWGRKSNLSKAQLKAKLDIADGKQISLKGSLGAVMTPVVVSK